MESSKTVQIAVASALGGVALYLLAERLISPNIDTVKKESSYKGGDSAIGRALESTQLEKYNKCVYLDYNATTPLFPEVTRAMEPFTWACFGNPSSSHVYATPCREALKTARSEVAMLINAENDESVIFTSCGSESDNRAIDIAIYQYNAYHARFYHVSANANSKGEKNKNKEKGKEKEKEKDADISHLSLSDVPLPHIISSTIEHPAILVYLQHLEGTGKISLSLVGVDEEGIVNPRDVSTTSLRTYIYLSLDVFISF